MVSKLKQKEYLKSYFTALKGKMIPICSCIRITNACNMSCDYCSVVKDNKNDISISKWKKVVDTLYKLGNREINITGGEPLLRKDLFELVSYISKKNIIVSVSTNGTLLNNENIKELNNSGLDYMSISVDTLKIDGYKYGKQFSDVEEILKNISKRKLNFKVEITPVINRNNFTEMPSLVKKFSKMGFDIRFMLMMPNLTYPQKDVKLRFKKSDIKKFEIVIKKLEKLKKVGYRIRDPYEYLDAMISYVKGCLKFKCPFGIELSINNDGSIIQCPDKRFLNTKIFNIKNSDSYRRFIERNKGYIRECDSCLWGCKFRLWWQLTNPIVPKGSDFEWEKSKIV